MSEIRPFSYRAPESALSELRQRLSKVRWPERETVRDWSQGVPLAKLRALTSTPVIVCPTAIRRGERLELLARRRAHSLACIAHDNSSYHIRPLWPLGLPRWLKVKEDDC
jgi:hypothetical protein